MTALQRNTQRLLKHFGTTVAFFCLFALTACEPAGQTDETTLQRIQREGVVRIGYANEAPYAYVDEKTGRLTGEAPEIARVILKQMGVQRVEGVLTEFGSLIPGLKAKRFDIIAAGMYILPKRCREIAFTNPTYRIGEAILVKTNNPLDLHSYEDIAAHASARIGVVAGAVELAYARATGIPDERIAVLPDAPSAVAAVQAERVDAYGGTALTVQDMLNKSGDGGVERAKPFTDPVIEGKMVVGYGAFGVRQDDKALRESLNKHLKTFIGSEQHRELVQPFGFTEAELPGDITAETLCHR
ncbi:MAG: ectoine/hydroxyectoine ABC transporter substrate-binding protein EhuB [Granulosicoccaceae bacterium]|jgi:polar amino acid transport system substrate-binding protein